MCYNDQINIFCEEVPLFFNDICDITLAVF